VGRFAVVIGHLQRYETGRRLILTSLLAFANMNWREHNCISAYLHFCRYPIQRALKLVAAISRDLNDRLLKVLGNQLLMQGTHEEFDRIFSGCKRVFNTWEDEDEMFRNILREIIKRRRDDSVKTFRRVKPQHDALKKRLEELGSFRKNHEQLRHVIARVLRPTSQEDAGGSFSFQFARLHVCLLCKLQW
jgi:hypothetical protein